MLIVDNVFAMLFGNKLSIYLSIYLCLCFSGERCLRQILEDGHRVAERCVNEEDREGINKLVSDITSMADALCELRQQGKVIIYDNLEYKDT